MPSPRSNLQPVCSRPPRPRVRQASTTPSPMAWRCRSMTQVSISSLPTTCCRSSTTSTKLWPKQRESSPRVGTSALALRIPSRISATSMTVPGYRESRFARTTSFRAESMTPPNSMTTRCAFRIGPIHSRTIRWHWNVRLYPRACPRTARGTRGSGKLEMAGRPTLPQPPSGPLQAIALQRVAPERRLGACRAPRFAAERAESIPDRRLDVMCELASVRFTAGL